MYGSQAPPVKPAGTGPAAFIPYLFLLGAVLGAIGCLGRADYNLPVFLFAYIAWSYLRRQKYYVVLMFIASIALDFIWFFFIYLAIWCTDDYSNLAGWERGIQKTCLVVAIINFVLKVISELS